MSRSQSVCSLLIGGSDIPLLLVPNRRARRYILRMQRGVGARVTIPRGGSAEFAKEFAARHASWIQKQLHKISLEPSGPAPWHIGTEILLRGEPVTLSAGENSDVILAGPERVRVASLLDDLRPAVESHLRRMAAGELPPRVFELAAAHGLAVQRVTVRNQRSRWGSCSRRGTVSLNWRLIHAPPFVRDYIVLHELMHLRQMNHSPRFWREVELACPDYRTAEAWLRAHSALLR